GSNGTDPTWGTNLTAITPSTAGDSASITGNFISCSCTSSWATFSGTFAIPTSCKNLVVVIFGNNQLSTSDAISAAEVDLFEGATVRDWTPRSYRQELQYCQRYFGKTFSVDTAPAQNAGTDIGECGLSVWNGGTALTYLWERYWFSVSMRAAPTVTFYNPSASNGKVRNVTTSTDIANSPTADNLTEQGFNISHSVTNTETT